jgi:beta-glucosidase
MLSINWSDVISILQQIRTYLIVIGVAVVAAVIVMIACRKQSRAAKFVIRSEAAVAMFLVILVVVNLICTGPMSTILTLASGNGALSEETSAEAEALGQEIAEEGIVLLQNNDNLLPLSDTNVNVFGWASTAPWTAIPTK